MTDMNVIGSSYGATPVESRQVGGVPGLRRGPPNATGGTSASTCGAGRRDQRLHATGQKEDNKEQKTFKILQWNAAGILNKKEVLKNRLFEHQIDIACIQETHLTDKNPRFSIRGYQNFRIDREPATKTTNPKKVIF